MSSDGPELVTRGKEWRRELGAVGILAALTLLMFADVLWRGNAVLLSKENLDIWSYFYWIRDWGFAELRKGHLALWNPHILCGCPFFGNFQSALLYPLNAMFLKMETVKAMNLNIALHVFLAGLSMYMWCRGRGVSRTGGIVGGVIFMFCGGYFVKILAGHLNHLTALVWAPLLFLAIDKLFDSGKLKWSALGGLSLAMQVLAGAPQFAYYTGLAAGLYVLLNLITHKHHRGRIIVGFALMGVLAGMLSAWQVTLGMQLESHRSAGLDVEDAVVGVISPVRLLTLIAPMPFGHDLLTLNIGAAGLVLAIHGAIRGSGAQKRFALTIAIIMAILAMGHFTPLFQLLYDHLPGYALFRVVGRFATISALFLAMLAGIGFDRLRDEGKWRLTASVALLLALLAIGLGVAVLATISKGFDGLAGWMLLLLDGGWRSPDAAERLAELLPQRARWLWMMLLTGGGLLLLTTALMALSQRWPRTVYLVAALVPLELFISAMHTRVTMEMPMEYAERWRRRVVVSRSNDARTYHLNLKYANAAMHFRSFDGHGYEAVVPHRYAMLKDELREVYREHRDISVLEEMPGVWKMLRVQYLLTTRPKGGVKQLDPPLGRLELIENYALLADQKELLKAICDPQFDPRQLVYLEREPAVRPQPGGAQGAAKVTHNGTDRIEIHAELPKPAILLMTDSYSTHWHVTALPGSAQDQYEIMPANLALRAIPLGAGAHKLRLEYRPRFYYTSMSVSALTAAGYLVGLAMGGINGYRRRRSARAAALSSSAGNSSSSDGNPAVSATR